MTIQRINSGRGHWYKVDGKKADGVTTAIKQGLPAPALMYWSARCVAEFVADNREHVRECMDWMDRDQLVRLLKETPWSARDKAAVRGTEVHALAEKITHGEEVDVPDHLTGYVASAVAFLDDWEAEPVVTEAVVGHHKWGYAGTLDAVYRLPGGRIALSDWKTGASGIWPETVLQLNAYANADTYMDGEGEHPMSELGITEAFAVHVREDGYSVHPIPLTDGCFQTFLYCLAISRWAKNAKQLIGDPVPAPEAVA
ncbi:MAG TPA: hypothetical protein VFJ19_09195 [Nocardioidaceae bacterium]|nr:hypothetical protein [Nocardioidaceae bacterium]